jgi:hypothetical protein
MTEQLIIGGTLAVAAFAFLSAEQTPRLAVLISMLFNSKPSKWAATLLRRATHPHVRKSFLMKSNRWWAIEVTSASLKSF